MTTEAEGHFRGCNSSEGRDTWEKLQAMETECSRRFSGRSFGSVAPMLEQSEPNRWHRVERWRTVHCGRNPTQGRSVRRKEQQRQRLSNCPQPQFPILLVVLMAGGGGDEVWSWDWKKSGAGGKEFKFSLCFSPSSLFLMSNKINYFFWSWGCSAHQ